MRVERRGGRKSGSGGGVVDPSKWEEEVGRADQSVRAHVNLLIASESATGVNFSYCANTVQRALPLSATGIRTGAGHDASVNLAGPYPVSNLTTQYILYNSSDNELLQNRYIAQTVVGPDSGLRRAMSRVNRERVHNLGLRRVETGVARPEGSAGLAYRNGSGFLETQLERGGGGECGYSPSGQPKK